MQLAKCFVLLVASVLAADGKAADGATLTIPQIAAAARDGVELPKVALAIDTHDDEDGAGARGAGEEEGLALTSEVSSLQLRSLRSLGSSKGFARVLSGKVFPPDPPHPGRR
jgi:hypothetical protein